MHDQYQPMNIINLPMCIATNYSIMYNKINTKYQLNYARNMHNYDLLAAQNRHYHVEFAF